MKIVRTMVAVLFLYAITLLPRIAVLYAQSPGKFSALVGGVVVSHFAAIAIIFAIVAIAIALDGCR